MAYEYVRLSRDDLYERVWSAPVRDVAQHYGVSAAAVTKACDEFGVPMPPHGHWARAQAGTALPRPSLPPLAEGQRTERHIEVWRAPLERVGVTDTMRARLDRERAAESIVVPATLRDAHPLVAEAAKLLARDRADDRGIVDAATAHACLDVAVSEAARDRALRVADALLKALAARGFRVEVSPAATARRDPPEWVAARRYVTGVRVEEDWVPFGIREETRRFDRPPPPPTRTTRGRVEPVSVSYWDRFETRPTGKLSVVIHDIFHRHSQRVWSDARKQRLETCLNDVVVGILRTSAERRAWRVDDERRDQARRDAERQREEAARRDRLRAAWRHDLDSRVHDWLQARAIREFAAAVEADAARDHGPPPPAPELTAWLAWARQHADEIERDAIRNVLQLREDGS